MFMCGTDWAEIDLQRAVEECQSALGQMHFLSQELCPECHLTVVSGGPQVLTPLGHGRRASRSPPAGREHARHERRRRAQALKEDPRLGLVPVVRLSISSAWEGVQAAYILYARSDMVNARDVHAILQHIERCLTSWPRVNYPAHT